MATASKKWVVLEKRNFSAGSGDLDYLVALYANVTDGSANSDGVVRTDFFKNSTATSQWTGIPSADLASLQSGQIVERVISVSYPAGTLTSVILADLDSRQATFQAYITAYSAAIGDRYGVARNADGTLRNTTVG